ncbi:MAG: hypothetical protein AB8B71_13650 [Paracoccaceae bacterium]
MRNAAMSILVLSPILLAMGLETLGANQPLRVFNGDSTILISVTNILLVFLVFATFIERACEIALSLLTSLRLVPQKIETEASGGPNDRTRRLVGGSICFVFAMIIALVGVRLIETTLTLATLPADYAGSEPWTLTGIGPSFVVFDTILTALILSGGSEQIHKIISNFEQ